MGFDQKSDAFYEWYLVQLDVFCKGVDLSNGATLSKQALEFYIHLVNEKRNNLTRHSKVLAIVSAGIKNNKFSIKQLLYLFS